MGQTFVTMGGQQQSKDELLYQFAVNGDIQAIKSLCREGAGLEWIDRDGKTPLIVACMNPALYTVAQALIELGANVNAFRPGRHAGTPLHHAAKRGLDATVKLLLSHGANNSIRNDDCQTPLDVARLKGYTNVVRTIENHISYFSGWLREMYGPGFLEALAPQLLSRKIWGVVVSCGSINPAKPLKLELVIYGTPQIHIERLLLATWVPFLIGLMFGSRIGISLLRNLLIGYFWALSHVPSILFDSQPRTVIALWKAKIEEPKFHQSDPTLIILDKSTKTRYKLASAKEGDKPQIQWLYDACRGIPQGLPPPLVRDAETSVTEAAAATQTDTEAMELATAISASIQSTVGDRPPLLPNTHQSSEAISTNGWENPIGNAIHNACGSSSRPAQLEPSSSGSMDKPAVEKYNGWDVPDSGPSGNPTQHTQTQDRIPSIVQPSNRIHASFSADPSAPPIPVEDFDESLIHYPSIDLSPVDLSVPAIEDGVSKASDEDNGGSSSLCVICWEAPAECACVPCGHVAGCMGCLKEIKAKKGVCPVCRSKIDQVIRLYAV